MTDKKRKQHLLPSLLELLVREWGYEAVQRSLDALHADQDAVSPRAVREGGPARPHRRPDAVEIVDRLDLPDARKGPLLELASRFDAKAFLASASDVKHFLEMRGRGGVAVKHRQDSFRKVLDALVDMSADELDVLRASSAHSGPTQLGPLSDAIKATSAAVRGVVAQPEPTGSSEARDHPERGNLEPPTE